MNSNFAFLSAVLLAGCVQVPQASDPEPAPIPMVIAAPLSATVDAVEVAQTHTLPKVEPEELPGLHNVFHLSERIVSGAEPQGDHALDELQSMGIKTILSVDGKAPDWKAAEARGMRYVHIPIQYSGIEQDQLDHIAKTFRELPGPFYVHCYHGKHRGPAAAAVGRMVLDGAAREEALAEMLQWCGTATNYKGLFDEIAFAEMPTAAETAAESFDFPAQHMFDGVRAGMIPMGRHWDELKYAAKHDWQVDPEHPDIQLAHEAEQCAEILEHCKNMADFDSPMPHSEEVLGWFQSGHKGTIDLARILRSRGELEAQGVDWRAQAADAYKVASSSCKDCHSQYRD
ncbi:MAG TPA: hypothetical protein PLJ12_11035 [Planctomycetota bacterium]|nr:hypothetical protein [Planctomycetota bacterium]